MLTGCVFYKEVRAELCVSKFRFVEASVFHPMELVKWCVLVKKKKRKIMGISKRARVHLQKFALDLQLSEF